MKLHALNMLCTLYEVIVLCCLSSFVFRAEYWSLLKALPSQKAMKTKLCSEKLIIVDEISIGFSLTLTYMHLRLEELFGGDGWFGSIFVGDLLQHVKKTILGY